MKLGNKGFAISSVLYMALVVFLILITSLLAMMGGRKNILDKLRNDAFANVNGIPEKDTDVIAELDIAFPTMTDNMIPIVYTPTGLVVKADTTGNTNRNWYNYNQRKWANAILVKETGTQTREYYQNADPGTTINTDDILAYFVWIPRYRYNVNTTTKEVNVVFENKSVSKSSGSGINGSDYTHSAFTWNGKELNGIWIGKFETSGEMANSYSSGLTGLTILPAKAPISNESIKKMFLNSRKMEVKGNIYGFQQSGSNRIDKILSCTTLVNGMKKCTDDTCMTYCGTIENDSNKIDPHVTKNIEWGVVALLSQSIYGKNGGLTPNTNINCTSGECEKLAYILNSNQSTTGNVYGIYDMSGGLWEITMGYYNTLVFREDSTNNYEISTIYYDKYASSAGIKGDATILEDSSNVLTERYFSTRGGLGNNPSTAGIAKFGSVKYSENNLLGIGDIDSTPSETTGFRLSLVIWE